MSFAEWSTIFFKKENALSLSAVFAFSIFLLTTLVEITLFIFLKNGILVHDKIPFLLKCYAFFSNSLLVFVACFLVALPLYLIFYNLIRWFKTIRIIYHLLRAVACILLAIFIVFEIASFVDFIYSSKFVSLLGIELFFNDPFEIIDPWLRRSAFLVFSLPAISLILSAFILYTLNKGFLLRPGASFRTVNVIIPFVFVILTSLSFVFSTLGKQSLIEKDCDVKCVSKKVEYVEKKTSPLLSLKADYFKKVRQ